MELAILLAQIVATGGLAAWLSLGVRDNLLHPSLNETYTTEVMEMTRLRTEYPEAFEKVAHRAITNRRVQLLAFRTVVAVELLATVLLWLGTLALLFSLIGLVTPQVARAIALTGATVFVAIWSTFLVVGNHFSYWFCHEGAQSTHYQMTLWGLGVSILLIQS